MISYFAGLHRSSPTELSLWRDSQAVQAYLGGPPIIAKLPSPNSWASRTAASCALSKNQQQVGQPLPPSQPQPQQQSSEHHYEEIMELKRQLVHTNQDLHLTKVDFLNRYVVRYPYLLSSGIGWLAHRVGGWTTNVERVGPACHHG